MDWDVKVIESTNENVKKYIFEKPDAIAEAVVYKYPTYDKRTVICCSVMSGCPVGCVFCGTGKKFIRNLTASEIIQQVKKVVDDIEAVEGYSLNRRCSKFQIMFMSMGEPMLNYEVFGALEELSNMYGNAQLLVSTVGIKDDKWYKKFLDLAYENELIGLQFSIHDSEDWARDRLIPFHNKWTLEEIRDMGIAFYVKTGRKVYLNYCVTELNCHLRNIEYLRKLFSPMVFAFTFSVVCSAEQGKTIDRDMERILKFQSAFPEYSTRIFDPAGQDDIGGGCGQLWYVQDWMRRNESCI